MIPLLLAWTLLTVSLWTLGLSQTMVQGPVKDLYPAISSPVTIECDCGNFACDTVVWFRSISSQDTIQYLGRHNNADRYSYGPDADESKFKFTKRGNTFQMRISSVNKEDAGFYSCILNNKNTDIWKPGSLLWPGVTPPTPPPVTKPKPPNKPNNKCCNKNNPPQDGCGAQVLWPLVGLTAGLGLGLLCVLCYFSRLPKKCRHHFQKKPHMPRYR